MGDIAAGADQGAAIDVTASVEGAGNKPAAPGKGGASSWEAAAGTAPVGMSGVGQAEKIMFFSVFEAPSALPTSALQVKRRHRMGRGVDQELSALIHEVIDASLLDQASPEYAVALLVAEKGQSCLDSAQRSVWESRVLPILSKPIHEQIAIAAILRRGGYVPRKIEF